ncbi:MAG: hypothetical protein J7M14_04120 [Planctomycetes bacterium]|nr:hypothetical protein [Planctomycetota bacterium]
MNFANTIAEPGRPTNSGEAGFQPSERLCSDWRLVLVIPLAWLAGIVSLQAFGYLLPERLAFIASVCGAAVGVVLLWRLLLVRLDNRISLWIILLICAAKTLFVFHVWTTNVFAPQGAGDLVVAQQEYFEESYHYWDQVNLLIDWWRDEGFSLLPPPDELNINHPQALMLVSLPLSALPRFSEVLIPWNVFYMTAAACAVYAIGRIEGFSRDACRAAFFLVMLQPGGWYVWAPLKRDIQCQMLFAAALLAILVYRKRLIFLGAVTATSCAVLSLYRIAYGPIAVVAAVFASVLERGQMNRKAAIRSVAILGVLAAALLITLDLFPESVVSRIPAALSRYGVGDVDVVIEKAYQPRLIHHGSWIASIPDRLLLGLFSPFPWTEVLRSGNLFEVFWKVLDYLRTAIVAVCLGAIAVFGLLDLRRKIFPPVSVAVALMVAVSGMVGFAVQNVYVQIGMFLSFPYVFSKLGSRRAAALLAASVGMFLILSVIWAHLR